MIKSIHPTKWDTLKTEAVDLESNFYWVDDGLLATEREAVGKRWIPVNVYKNPDVLLDVWDFLKERSNDGRR